MLTIFIPYKTEKRKQGCVSVLNIYSKLIFIIIRIISETNAVRINLGSIYILMYLHTDIFAQISSFGYNNNDILFRLIIFVSIINI
jgi:hypothetical protein